MRSTWQRELESVRAEVAHKRALAGAQLRSREEDEQVAALEFHARQRMWALEQDATRAAVASKVGVCVFESGPAWGAGGRGRKRGPACRGAAL